MNKFLKSFLALSPLIVAAHDSDAQSMHMRFTNRQVSADGLHWSFDLEAKADESYVGPTGNEWRAMNVRLDLTLPNGVTVQSGSGVPNSTYAGSIAVQPIIGGGPQNGANAVMGVTAIRTTGVHQDLNTADFVKLGTYTVNFSAPVNASDPATPRPQPIQTGSSWTNISSPTKRLIIFEDASFSLPVKLVHFNAVKEGDLANLTWATSEEVNSDHFDVQKSHDGKKWSILTTVKAKGESNSLVEYSATDKEPLRGTNLYRLHLIDRDGSDSYSKIQSLNFEIDPKVKVYPNPVSDQLFIVADDVESISEVQIFNSAGLKVYQSVANPDGKVDVSMFNTGVYLVKVLDQTGMSADYKVLIAR